MQGYLEYQVNDFNKDFGKGQEEKKEENKTESVKIGETGNCKFEMI